MRSSLSTWRGKSHSENARILSKLTNRKQVIDHLHAECGELLIRGLWEAMQIHKENTAIMIRIAYVYANFTTFYPDVRI